MIKPSQKKRVIKAFGKHYSTPLIKELNKLRVKNAKGTAFSASSIRQIVGAIRPNEPVEKKIMQIVNKKLEK